MGKPRKGVPWLRMSINVFADIDVRIGRCGAAWAWCLVQMKLRRRSDGAVDDRELHPMLLAQDMGLSDEAAFRQLEALKSTDLIEQGDDGFWRTENWHLYQPDQRVGKYSRDCQDMTPMSRFSGHPGSSKVELDAPGSSKAEVDEGSLEGAHPVDDRITPHLDTPDPAPDGRRLTSNNMTTDVVFPPGGEAIHSNGGEGSGPAGLGNGWQQEGVEASPPPVMEETPFGPRPVGAPKLECSDIPKPTVDVHRAYMAARGVTSVNRFDATVLAECLNGFSAQQTVEAIQAVQEASGRTFDAKAVKARLYAQAKASRRQAPKPAWQGSGPEHDAEEAAQEALYRHYAQKAGKL